MKFGYGFNKNSSVNGGFNIRSTHPVALWMLPSLIDIIGLSISELYTLVDPALQSIVSADGGVTRRSDADIWALMLASPLLNTRTMVANSDNGGAIYRYDTSDGILFKVKRYFGVIEPFCAFGNVPFNTSDNNQVWVLT